MAATYKNASCAHNISHHLSDIAEHFLRPISVVWDTGEGLRQDGSISQIQSYTDGA